MDLWSLTFYCAWRLAKYVHNPEEKWCLLMSPTHVLLRRAVHLKVHPRPRRLNILSENDVTLIGR